jgi:flagellar protein FlaG
MASDIGNIGISSLSSPVLDDKSGRKTASVVSETSSVGASGTLNSTGVKDVASVKTEADLKKSSTERPKLEDVKKQVQSLQDLSHSKGWSVNFAVDDESDKTIIKVVDADTQKVIRQIPSEEMLTISKRIQAMQNGESSISDLSGLLFDHQA